MFHRTNNPDVPTGDIDVHMEEELEKVRPYCPCEEMDSEDPLFLLYTSGSTGTHGCVRRGMGGGVCIAWWYGVVTGRVVP